MIPGLVACYKSRSPCGERGLKYSPHADKCAPPRSLPVRGAWIEIRWWHLLSLKKGKSLPVRGAWIEMSGLNPL